MTKFSSKGLDDRLERCPTSSFHIIASCNDVQIEENVEDAPLELEKGVKSTVGQPISLHCSLPFQAHTVHLISKSNPLKYVMTKPVLSDRLARWSFLFQQFEIVYVP